MRIVIGEFRQETNSFNPIVSTMDFWKKGGIFEGKDIYTSLENKPCSIAGIIKALREVEENMEIVPGISMSCQSGGPTDQSVMDYFLKKFLPIIQENVPVDGIFLSFHGALQTLKYDDAEGVILEKIRSIVGSKTVIAIATDLHAYISDRMLKHADVITGYHTYPHIDMFETGYRAAKLGLDYLLNGIEPKMVCVKIPMIVPAGAYNTIYGPFKELMEYGQTLVKNGTIRDFSIFQMQPWLDVSEGKSSVLVIAKDYKTAEIYARKLAQRLFDLRSEFKLNQYSIDEVIDIAEKNQTGKPVILVDSADSCNAGAPGDSMAVVDRLLERGSSIKVATVVNDIPAANLAHKIGVGSKSIFSIGGTRDPKAKCIRAEGYVKSLHDGVFIEEVSGRRGMVNSVGPTAVIKIGNIDIVVCHYMAASGDPQLYRAFGVEPTFYQLVIVKACTSFRAAYSLFADVICETDTPGAASGNLKSLEYKNLPIGSFYPWSNLDDYIINEIIYARK